MYWISFGRWNHAAGRFFIANRVLIDGYRWTPIVKLRSRLVY